MAKNIPTTQWTRLDEPVLDLTSLRVVRYNGGYAVTNDETAEEQAMPTVGVVVEQGGDFYVQT